MTLTPRGMLLIAALLLLPAGAQGQAVLTEFTATETLLIPGPIDWGTVSCPGGQQIGPWPSFPPCSPGSRVHIRGMKWLYKVEATDPRINGEEVVVSNGNWDGWTPFGPGPGPMWGTLRLEVTEGGSKTGEVWEGTWTGMRNVTEQGAFSSIKAQAHGSGGRIEGLTAKWEIALDPVAQVGQATGRILAPGSE